MTIITCVVFLLIGCAIGAITMSYINRTYKSIGALQIDESDPDGDYMFLHLYAPVDVVKGQKQVMVDVCVTRRLSQK